MFTPVSDLWNYSWHTWHAVAKQDSSNQTWVSCMFKTLCTILLIQSFNKYFKTLDPGLLQPCIALYWPHIPLVRPYGRDNKVSGIPWEQFSGMLKPFLRLQDKDNYYLIWDHHAYQRRELVTSHLRISVVYGLFCTNYWCQNKKLQFISSPYFSVFIRFCEVFWVLYIT